MSKPCALLALVLLVPAGLGATDKEPQTCIIDGMVFDDCPLEQDPIDQNGPGGGLLALHPDLSARGGGFILAPNQIAPGQQFTANAVIENFGGLDYSPTQIRVDFYLSPVGNDALLPENFLGSTDIVFPVVTSATLGEVGVLVTLGGTLPAIASGQYRLAIDIDVDDALPEVSEINNSIAAGETIHVGNEPDLVPQTSGFNLSAPVVQGGLVTIASTLRNQGGGGISGPTSFVVRYRAVPQGGDELGGTVLGSATVTIPGGTSLAAGASRAVPAMQAHVTLPPGEYQIGADVDFAGSGAPAGAIAESNESNNSLILGAMVVQASGPLPFPDYQFEIAKVTFQEADPVSAGDRLYIAVKLKDPGPNIIPNVFPALKVVASDDKLIEATDTTLRFFAQHTDASGANILNQQVELVVPWPAGIPDGTYFVGVVIDPRNDIPGEPDKTNNTVLLLRVTTKDRCPRRPKLGHAEAAFDELFTEQVGLSFPGIPPLGVRGEYCTGGVHDDFDFFETNAVSDDCLMVLPYFHARRFVEDELLPAMLRACVTTLSGLYDASKPDALLADVAAFRLKDELEASKQACDAYTPAQMHRRYCICPNTDFLSWAPPPYPDGPGCLYTNHPLPLVP